MAIDPRISLTPAPTINVGERFGQALRNVQGYDNLQQNRQLAPLKQQAAQMQMEVAQQQQAQANDPLNQAVTAQNTVNELDQNNAIQAQQAISTGNPDILKSTLLQQRAVTQNLVKQGVLDANEVKEFDSTLAMLDQDGGFEKVSQGISSYLQGNQQQSVKQAEFESLLQTAQNPNATDTERRAANIALGLTARAGSSAQERTAEDENKTVSQLKADQARTVEEIKTKETGRRKALNVAGNFSETANQTMIQIPSVLRNYKDAIEQIDKGANTGVIYNMLPSIDTNALILNNIAKSAGFNLAKSQGGIMTDADLKFGIDVAIPRDLPPTELKDFLNKKIRVQTEVYNNLLETVKFLGDGEKTLTDWYKQKGKQSKTAKMSDDQLLKGM